MGVAASACERPGPSPAGQEVEPRFEAVVTEAWAAGGLQELGGLRFESQQTFLWGVFGPDGDVLVIDRDGPHAHVLDSGGSARMRLGRRGEGPGEFQQAVAGGFIGDSLIWVSDPSLVRLTRFHHDGRLHSTRQHEWQQISGGAWTARPSRVLEGETLLASTREPRGQGSDLLASPLVFLDSTGEVMRVADWIERPQARDVVTTSGVTIQPPQPFQAQPLIGVAAGDHWVFVLRRGPDTAEMGHIPIVRYSAAGDVMDTVRIPYQPTPVPASTRAGAAEVAERYVQQMPPQLGVRLDDVVEAMWIPNHLPPVERAFADSSGFWLRTGRGAPIVWDRYDLDGRLVAHATLPDDSGQVLAATPTSFLTWASDALGVAIVRRYDVTLTPAGVPGR